MPGKDIAGGWLIANRAATKLNIEPVKAHANFIDHARAEVVRLAQQDCLAESGNVEHIPGCSIVIGVEIISAIENVTSAQRILASEGYVFLGYKVEAVERSGKNAGDSAHFNGVGAIVHWSSGDIA